MTEIIDKIAFLGRFVSVEKAASFLSKEYGIKNDVDLKELVLSELLGRDLRLYVKVFYPDGAIRVPDSCGVSWLEFDQFQEGLYNERDLTTGARFEDDLSPRLDEINGVHILSTSFVDSFGYALKNSLEKATFQAALESKTLGGGSDH